MVNLNLEKLNALAKLADQLILDATRKKELKDLLKVHLEKAFIFENDLCEGYFYYILGNCSSDLYHYKNESWYSQDLINTVNLYQKSVFYLKKASSDKNLLSFALTNLGNFLSSQGRCFCAQYYWDQAIELNENPVAIIAKAQSLLFISSNLYDEYHTEIHYFFINKLVKKVKLMFDTLESEQKTPLQPHGNLYTFNQWYEQHYQDGEFKFIKEYEQKIRTKIESRYLRWCAKNKLFINDLNDLCIDEIVFQDVIGLPSITQRINTSLSLKEQLVFHSNFDELRNEYTYARYLIFQASEIKDESKHFYNATYAHTDDTLHAIDNLKTSHLKSAFRILYSIFDKISYFLTKYLKFEVNDRHISFSKVFGNNKNRKFQPREVLKNSNNYFIHALFYILKEIEEVDSEHFDIFTNSKQYRFSKIRNHLEHRSFRIVDDFGYRLNTEFDFYHSAMYEKLLTRKHELIEGDLINSDEFKEVLEQIQDKEKKANYILEMPISEFEESLLTLARLIRNSLMYLSLAVHLEESWREGEDKLVLSRFVPLKK